MTSLTQLRKLNPDARIVRDVASLGLRLGVDKVPVSIRGDYPRPAQDLPSKMTEPHWHASTLPAPPVKIVPLPWRSTTLGRFVTSEWKRLQVALREDDFGHNGVPHPKLRNPFLPFFSPITKTWLSPLYSMREQAALVKAARRLSLSSILPSGPKTPGAFANRFVDTWDERAGEKVELGRVLWHGEYEKKLNPFGAGKYDEIKAEEERTVGDDVERWGPYKGRAILFKGTAHERARPSRQAEIDARMKAMPKRIEQWKKDRETARAKKRSTLPF